MLKYIWLIPTLPLTGSALIGLLGSDQIAKQWRKAEQEN